MKTLTFTLESQAGQRPLPLDVRGVLICGYTGRDQSSVRAHIEELKTEGIAPPPSVPAYFPKLADTLVMGDALDVHGAETCGEVEFVVLPQGDKLYIAAGSDHTDRALEKADMTRSKQICPAVVSAGAWDYAEVREHWDRIELRSHAVVGGKRVPYQEAPVGTILKPEELVRLGSAKVNGAIDGIALYSGTPPLKTGQFVYGERFEGELYDPVLKRSLTVSYAVRVLDWYRP